MTVFTLSRQLRIHDVTARLSAYMDAFARCFLPKRSERFGGKFARRRYRNRAPSKARWWDRADKVIVLMEFPHDAAGVAAGWLSLAHNEIAGRPGGRRSAVVRC